MAETLTFSSGSFNLNETPAPGTEKLGVDDQGGGSYLLANTDDSTIKGLGIQGGDEPLKLTITSEPGKATLRYSTISLGNQDDELIIGDNTRQSEISTGGGDDTTRVDGVLRSGSEFDTGDGADRSEFAIVRDSSISMGDGNDRATFNGKVVDSQVSMGTGNDQTTFNGDVDGSSVDMGPGEDILIFGGDIKQTNVQLGSDGQPDTIQIAGNSSIEGLVINGADENDILFIGSSQYSYEGSNTWVNINDPNDVRTF
jgi:hypothetical protein